MEYLSANNQSILDSLGSYASRYITSKSDYFHLFDYIKWDENIIEKTIIDKYNRIVAICFIDNININQLMILSGWAIAYRYYSKEIIPRVLLQVLVLNIYLNKTTKL